MAVLLPGFKVLKGLSKGAGSHGKIDVIWRRHIVWDLKSQPSAVLVIFSYYLSRIHKRQIVDKTRFNKIMHHIQKIKKKIMYPGKTTWSPKMEMWKMIFRSKWMIFRFHLSFWGRPSNNDKLYRRVQLSYGATRFASSPEVFPTHL